MLEILKYTYLLDNKKLRVAVERYWRRYLKIIKKPRAGREEANEARAILYFLGYLFPEKIALESLARRMKQIKPKTDLNGFLKMIDAGEKKKLSKYKKNKNFQRLKEFYLIVKSIKNRVGQDNTYLAEASFNKFYDRLKPKGYF